MNAVHFPFISLRISYSSRSQIALSYSVRLCYLLRPLSAPIRHSCLPSSALGSWHGLSLQQLSLLLLTFVCTLFLDDLGYEHAGFGVLRVV